MERIKVDEQTGKVEQLENTIPSNINDIEKVLGEQINAPTEEKEKAWKEIKDMTDKELREAIENSSTAIPEGDGKAPKAAEGFDPMSLELKKVNPVDMLTLIDLTVKIKADPKFNPVPEIPKSIYSIINMQGKLAGWNNAQIANYAKFMVMELVDEFNFDKDLKLNELTDALKDSAAITNGSILFVAQPWEIKKQYEEDFIKDATENPKYTDKERADRIAISKAFTAGYTLERQLELMKDDKFIAKIPKLLRKKFNRMCDDFDYLLSKTQVKPTSVKEILQLMDHVVKVGTSQKMIYVLFLCELTKNAGFDDKAASMFMYSSIYNIRTLANSGDLKDSKSFADEDSIKFVNQRIGYIKTFFETLEKRNNEFTNIDEEKFGYKDKAEIIYVNTDPSGKKAVSATKYVEADKSRPNSDHAAISITDSKGKVLVTKQLADTLTVFTSEKGPEVFENCTGNQEKWKKIFEDKPTTAPDEPTQEEDASSKPDQIEGAQPSFSLRSLGHIDEPQKNVKAEFDSFSYDKAYKDMKEKDAIQQKNKEMKAFFNADK